MAYLNDFNPITYHGMVDTKPDQTIPEDIPVIGEYQTAPGRRSVKDLMEYYSPKKLFSRAGQGKKNDIPIDEICKYRAEGFTYTEIGLKLGCSRSAVGKWMKNFENSQENS